MMYLELLLSAGSDKNKQVTPHEGQQIYLIFILQENNDEKIRHSNKNSILVKKNK